MGAFTVVQGRVDARQEAFDRSIDMDSVGTAGLVAPLALAQPAGELVRVLINRILGASAENFNVKIYDSNTYDAVNLVFEANSTGENRMDVCYPGITRFKSANSTLYVKITTASTNGHKFSVRLAGDHYSIK